MIFAAGLLIRAKSDGSVLLVRRDGSGDHTGEWCLPGGKLEEGETPLQAALRECGEEIGVTPLGEPVPMVHRVKDGVDFRTFFLMVPEPFEPPALAEHDGSEWVQPRAAVEDGSLSLHPGVKPALMRLYANETQLAELLRDGELASPLRFQNLSLVDLRITGTGVSHRAKADEFVYRPPEIYLTDDFLRRCQGLAVILDHPDGDRLDSVEYAERNVGAIVLPYIRGDEVWGVAKIYDDFTRKLLEDEDISTSPAVVFTDPTVNKTVALRDGSRLLIEGDPGLLDHLALCENGVWDKGGIPTGATSSTNYGDTTMPTEEERRAEEEAAAEKTRKDADVGTKLDKLLTGIDSVTKRLDALEGRKDGGRKDGDPDPEANPDAAAELAADKAKKDAETAEEKEALEKAERAKQDKAMGRRDGESDEDWDKRMAADRKDGRKDGETESSWKERRMKEDKAKTDAEAMSARLDAIEKKTEERSDDDMEAMTDAQAKADSVMSMFGRSAGRPLSGETLLAYRKRQARLIQGHSDRWKGVDVYTLPAAAFAVAEADIYADAQKAATAPTDVPLGQLREVRRADRTGRMVSTFYGDPDSWMREFKSPARLVTHINKEG